MKASDIKELLIPADVRAVLESLGYEFTRSGHFKIRDERTPSSHIDPKNGRIKDFGSGWSGDIFDLLQEYHGMDFKAAVDYVAGELGLSACDIEAVPAPIKRETPQTPTKDNDALARELERRAEAYLNASMYRMHGDFRIAVPRYVPVEVVERGRSHEIVTVDRNFEKLFEGQTIEAAPDFMAYLFNRLVGWDDYFQCPVIVVRDIEGRVVNIVRYRPKPRREGDTLPKYLQTKADERPDYPYLFPFEIEMRRLLKKERICYVGEGLKNALNALTLGVPFVSTESASTIKPDMAAYLKTLDEVRFIGAFDGDEAGRKAYELMADLIPIEGNILPFDSGLDFTDWIRGAA